MIFEVESCSMIVYIDEYDVLFEHILELKLVDHFPQYIINLIDSIFELYQDDVYETIFHAIPIIEKEKEGESF